AAGLAELFLALDAGRDVVGHYEAEAQWRGVASVLEDLVHLVTQLALVEECPETDALTDAECLGDWAESVASDGHCAQFPVQSDAESALLAWHALGTVHPETIECSVCRAVYEADDESAKISECPECCTP